jgi:uncharacterized protein YbcI
MAKSGLGARVSHTPLSRPVLCRSDRAQSSCGALGYRIAPLGASPTLVFAWKAINENLVSCLLQDTLTKPERSLVAAGDVDTVLEVRKRFQATMRDDLVAAAEDLTGRDVAVFMSQNHVDPDVALESFVLEPVPGDKATFHLR